MRESISSIGVDELLNKAFQLAYLIIGDRMTAIRIAVAAMDNMKVASLVQNKRHSYMPLGRSPSRPARNKVSLSEIQMLQRLVYIESEIYERLLEQQEGVLVQEDLIIHFIKHLVRITTKRNSFYVSLGLGRLLYNYTTAEATEIYNFVVQDPDRFRDDYYYRSRKGRLMNELKERFGKLVKSYRSNRKEERWQVHDNSERYASLVEECLRRFTPWSTICVLPVDFDLIKNITIPLLFKGVDPDKEHPIEINRMHTLLHPDCYRRLALALGFDSPDRRLEVPYFFISGGDQGPTDNRFNPPSLTEQELNAIKSSLDKKATRRRRGSSNSLCVYVDGVERVRVELAEMSSVQLKVGEESEAIQVRATKATEEIILATHLLAHDESGILPSQFATIAEGGQKVSFSVSISSSSDGSQNAFVNIEYRETRLIRAALLFLRQLKSQLNRLPVLQSLKQSNLLKPALLFLVMIVCVAGLVVYFQLRARRVNQPITSDQKEAASSSQSASKANTGETQQPPSVPPTPRHDQVEQKPPDDHIASNPQPAGPRITRGPQIRTPSAMLLSVKKVYVDPLGPDALSRQVREVLIDRLQSSNRFIVVQNRNDADAVFKGAATQMDKRSEKMSVILKLVNVDGQVVWPLTKNSGRSYTGHAVDICDKLLRDLLADMQRQERNR